jgi:hypothetical protein
MAGQIAQAATEFERQMPGQVPRSVTVVRREDTLVITLHGVAGRNFPKSVADPKNRRSCLPSDGISSRRDPCGNPESGIRGQRTGRRGGST